MKKIMVLVLLFGMLFCSGCERVLEETKQGNYKEGTYFGTAEDTFGGASNVASAVIYVDKNGYIASVFLDTTYTKDEQVTTKKTLGYDYNMKNASPSKKEWFEQMNILEDKIVAEQGIDWLKWVDSAKSKTDSVSGVTIKIDAIYKAIQNALEKAK